MAHSHGQGYQVERTTKGAVPYCNGATRDIATQEQGLGGGETGDLLPHKRNYWGAVGARLVVELLGGSTKETGPKGG